MENITYSAARNPRWHNEEQTEIILEVEFDHLPNDPWVETLCMATGDLPHIHKLYAEATNGDYGTIAAYAPLQITGDDAMDILRGIRDKKLAESDIDVTRQMESSGSVTQELKDYRQALRDLPANSSNAIFVQVPSGENAGVSWTNVTWPTKP